MNKVIVVGGGLAGLSACHTVIEHGGTVLLLDKNPFCGGNSTKATSGINAALTKTQLRKGIEDSVEQFERDTARSANLGKSDQSYPLAKTLAKDSDPAVEWLINSFGLDLSLVSRLGGHTHQRTHRGKERFPGMTITYALLEKLEEIEKKSNGAVARIINKAKVTGLIKDQSGAVEGVEYEKDGKKFRENGVVVIATGGFGADFTETSLLQKYRPDLGHLPTTNGSHCTGDGLKLATSVGGDLVDMEWVQVHPTGLVHPDDPNAKVKFLAAEALRGVGGLLLNSNGERFCDELGRRDYVTGEMNKNKGPFRLVLNGKAGKEIEWHCKHYIGRKLMKKFDSGKALADEMKISVEKLAQTFAAYNECAKKGTDQWGKKFFTNAPFDVNDHFFVSIVTPVVHYCMGGVKINTEGEVLGANDNVVPGVFAAGEVTGGVHGKNRLGGNSLIECVVFGRIAGRSSARYLLKTTLNRLYQNKTSNNQTVNRVCMIRNHLSATKEFTVEEVAKHNKKGDCWVIIRDDVYDVSKFMVDHPGGEDSILLYAGADATEQFELMHQESVLKKYGPGLVIGKLKGNKTSRNQTANKNVPELLKLTPSDTPSRLSGGTANILPAERAKGSFNVEELYDFLNGGKEGSKKRQFIEGPISKNPEDFHNIYNFSRAEYVSHQVKEFVRIHKPFKNFRPTREDICFMSDVAIGFGSLNNSHGIFLSTLMGQANDEQLAFWLPKLMNFEITGSYAQTELGHGSNVRGLSTIAEYDKNTEEFVLNTPTLTSMKWWPGCLGKVATHVVLFAQLLIDGKEYGINVFLLQIRDENHLPVPGVRLGDLGNKIGDNSNDTGFMILENVRIPREFMLAKYRVVTKDGKYENVIKADSKVHYTTMMTTRAMMVNTAAARLAQASMIAIRYSCVRQQGFVDTKSNVSYKTKEHKIVDHKIQQYRLFKQLALAYATKFTGRWMIEQLAQLEGKNVGIIKNTDILKELAATSAGLKSLCTIIATNGIEDLRKCCGGNGYLLHSGIAALACDYLWQVTAEGDFIILALLTARHLLKSVGKVFGGGKLTGIMEYFNVIGEPEFDLAKIKPSPAKNNSDYLNLNYLLNWFRYRSLERNINAAKDFNELISEKGMTFEEAWNVCSNDLLKAVHSHCYMILMQNFIQKSKEISSPSTQKVLTRLCILFALTNFLDDNWGDTLETDQYKYIKHNIANLMNEIRPDCVPLVDAFGYHDNVLKSSIGRYDGNVYEALFDAAQKSVLNRSDPFDGYEQYLKPHLNKELLKRGNKPILSGKL